MGLDMMLYKTKKNKRAENRKKLPTLRYGEDEEIAYWRKANMIHKWIYENCAEEGQEDYDLILVEKDKIEELLAIAHKVKDSIELVEGDVQNGSRYVNGEWQPIIEKGKIIKDATICKELLPTQTGFFFGNQSYNEYYAEDIDDTIEQLEKVLKEVDWETEFVYYWASY